MSYHTHVPVYPCTQFSLLCEEGNDDFLIGSSNRRKLTFDIHNWLCFSLTPGCFFWWSFTELAFISQVLSMDQSYKIREVFLLSSGLAVLSLATVLSNLDMAFALGRHVPFPRSFLESISDP